MSSRYITEILRHELRQLNRVIHRQMKKWHFALADFQEFCAIELDMSAPCTIVEHLQGPDFTNQDQQDWYETRADDLEYQLGVYCRQRDELLTRISQAEAEEKQEKEERRARQAVHAEPYVLPATATLPITIRTPADFVTVMVSPSESVCDLPLAYTRQFGFNPKLATRFKWFIMDENPSDAKEEEDDLLYQLNQSQFIWTPKTWTEQFSNLDQIPTLHLLVQEEDPKERIAKIEMILGIARRRHHLDFSADQYDDIYYAYNNWYLTYQPPANSNRYITMADFVQANLTLFTPLAAH